MLLFVLPSAGMAQKQLRKKYKELIGEGSKLINFGPEYSFEETENGQYIYKKYVAGTTYVTHEIEFKDRQKLTRHGKYAEWYTSGKIKALGNYRENERVGNWKIADADQIRNGMYVSNMKQGEWITYNHNGQVLSIAHFQNDTIHGKFVKFDTAGVKLIEQIWNKGKLHETPFRLNDDVTGYLEKTEAYFPGCEDVLIYEERLECAKEKMLRHIYSNLRYPAYARANGIQGMTVAKFDVSKEGNIENISIIVHVHESLDNATLDIVAQLPPFIPATINGEPVEYEYKLPINYKLGTPSRKQNKSRSLEVIGY